MVTADERPAWGKARETVGDKSNGVTRVVYIAGAGRSGSTLLGQMLGSLEDWVHCGETRTGLGGLINGTACGCGQKLSRCDYWNQVTHEAFGSESRAALLRANALRKRVAMNRHSLAWFSPAQTRKFNQNARELAGLLARLLGAVRSVAGASIVVDSSKTPAYGQILALSPAVDLTVVHLVRHSCAVAHAYARARVDPLHHEKIIGSVRHKYLTKALGWSAKNVALELLAGSDFRSIVVRYEDFVRYPDATLSGLLSKVRPGPAGLSAGRDGMLKIPVQHTLAGNPVRFASGPLRLRADEKWRTEISPLEKGLVAFVTWPLLMRYKYLGPNIGPLQSSSH